MVKIVSVLAIVAAAASANAFSFVAHSGTGYGGTSFSTTSTGTKSLGFKAKSYKWTSPTLDKCCIKFCDGSRETGYQCPSKSNNSVESANQFNKVVIGCGSVNLKC